MTTPCSFLLCPASLLTDRETANPEASPNPKGIYSGLMFLSYLGLIPLTDYVARTGALQYLVRTTVSLLPGCAPIAADANNTIAAQGMIPALAALYLFVSHGVTGALSGAGQTMARPEGLDLSHSRRHLGHLAGFPLRLYSAHQNLMENFPAWALGAALTQALRPDDAHLVSLLGLHVLAKVFVYYPAYLANVPSVRGPTHLFANAAAINVCWKLATAAGAAAAAV
ncbi:hypothetical protein PG985_014949 [Apiospora marii]|uniref:Uncharacterized protein n=1 Tax=Apiospora marii TaxID=335849 RepID=A0ABR1RIT3_9PEZI